MDFQARFVQALLNLVPVLQVTSAELSQLMSEEMHMPKGMSPVMKLDVGPFERPDDRFYMNHPYVNAVDLKNRKIRESTAGIRKHPEGRKTGHRDIPRWDAQWDAPKNGFPGPQMSRNFLSGTGSPPQHFRSFFQPNSEPLDVLRGITAVRNGPKGLETLSELLDNLKGEIHKVETALMLDRFEKLLNAPDKSSSENRNKLPPINGNIFNGINNITYNNQYQIENVFAINRLSDRIGSKLKEADARIINELTDRKATDVSQKAVNNFRGEGLPRADFSAGEQLSLHEDDLDLLRQLQKNFSVVFSRQNVSLDQMNQMSKIIDFVERYHGAVGRLRTSSEGVRGVQGRSRWKQRPEGKVLCDAGIDFFAGGEEEEEEEEKERTRPTARRKGSVKQ